MKKIKVFTAIHDIIAINQYAQGILEWKDIEKIFDEHPMYVKRQILEKAKDLMRLQKPCAFDVHQSSVPSCFNIKTYNERILRRKIYTVKEENMKDLLFLYLQIFKSAYNRHAPSFEDSNDLKKWYYHSLADEGYVSEMIDFFSRHKFGMYFYNDLFL